MRYEIKLIREAFLSNYKTVILIFSLIRTAFLDFLISRINEKD